MSNRTVTNGDKRQRWQNCNKQWQMTNDKRQFWDDDGLAMKDEGWQLQGTRTMINGNYDER
jgi:uncharacterized protein YjdB